MMTDKQLLEVAQRAVGAAKKAGADQAEAVLEFSNVFTGRVRDGKSDLIKQATRRGLGLRAFVGGRTGFVSTSDLRGETVDQLAAQAVALARIGEVDPHAGLPTEYGTALEAIALELFDPAMAGLSTEKKIEMALATEAAARAFDKRVSQVDGTTFTDTESILTLVHSTGASHQFRTTAGGLFTQALCDDEGGKQRSGGYGTFRRFLSELESPEKVGREAAESAVMMLGPTKISTRKAPVLMHPDIAAGWVQNLAGAFNGEQVFKKASFFTEKLGQKVGSELLTIVDDGTMKREPGTSPVDGEGVATRRNVLLDKGVVSTFLYDAYTARKAGTKSTGSANRGYDSTPAIGTHNLYVPAGTSKKDDMLKAFPSLFYMRDRGAFGWNPTTGDYTYQAAGLWIENGEVVHPVDEITVAASSLDMLMGIVMVGDDLNMQGGTNAPHILIREMTISGT